MAVPSFLNSAGIEHRLKPHCYASHEETELPRESAKPELPALQTEVTPLATLTRAAQFLAHDLRHHLRLFVQTLSSSAAAAYRHSTRDELLEEIRFAVGCMTDQLDSLLLCARTGHTMQPRRESLKSIFDRAVLMVRSQPELRDISISNRRYLPSKAGSMV